MLQKLQQVLRSLLSSVCGENPDAEGAGVGPDWPWERLWAGREKGWVGNEPSVLEREGNWLNPGDGYHVSNPLREFQGMRVGLIQEYCSQNQPLTPAKMVQKGCLADFNGSGQSSCGVLFILSFPLAGRGTSWFLRLSLYFSWLPSPWSKKPENMLIFCSWCTHRCGSTSCCWVWSVSSYLQVKTTKCRFKRLVSAAHWALGLWLWSV